ncbi:MAG: DUF4365 domain-containing protein [Kiritimatiellae bacterium]|nr:DUF4365 domain-containing protein [Kiritimatiellia bacterium]
MPKYSQAQQTGQIGEKWCFHFFTDAGLIVNETASGADFGVDATVEIPKEDRRLTGEQFNLQVKASKDPVKKYKNGRIHAPSIRIETIRYLFAKVVPTLIVVYDTSSQIAYWEWLHEAITKEDFINAVRANKKTMCPKMQSNQLLTEQVVGSITEDVVKMHRRIFSAVHGSDIREDGLVLYRVISSTLDFLLDWIVSVGFQDPSIRANHILDSAPNINEIDKRFFTESSKYSLIPPQHATTLVPVYQIGAVIHAFRSLRYFCDLLDSAPQEDVYVIIVKDSPLVDITRNTAEKLEHYYLSAYSYPEQPEEYKDLAHSALYNDHEGNTIGFAAPVVLIQTSLVSITLLLRDYLVSLRQWLFPPIPCTTPANPLQYAEDFSASKIQTVEQWLPSFLQSDTFNKTYAEPVE